MSETNGCNKMRANPLYIKLFSLMISLTTYIVLIDCEEDEDKDKDDWYADRHKPVATSRLRHKNWWVIAQGEDKGKPVTVADCGTTTVLKRVVGGSNAWIGQFPWIVLIEDDGVPFCGGAILNERWIVTAAHCFKERSSPQGLSIRTGTINAKQGIVYSVQKIIVHQKYNHDGFENSDIALLKTKQAVVGYRAGKTKLINGICLPSVKFEEPKAKYIIVAGWGKTGENRAPSNLLKYVSLDIMDPVTCARKFKVEIEGHPDGYNIYRSQICAFRPRKDACEGDSGGPVIEFQNGRAILIGVVSFGVGCASDFPGVYTKVSHFIDWITENVD